MQIRQILAYKTLCAWDQQLSLPKRNSWVFPSAPYLVQRTVAGNRILCLVIPKTGAQNKRRAVAALSVPLASLLVESRREHSNSFCLIPHQSRWGLVYGWFFFLSASQALHHFLLCSEPSAWNFGVVSWALLHLRYHQHWVSRVSYLVCVH